MFIFVIFACLLLCLVSAVILAPCLQFAFKLVEGEKNSFRDAFLITFKSELAKNSKLTVNAVCPLVAVYCTLGVVSDIVIAII